MGFNKLVLPFSFIGQSLVVSMIVCRMAIIKRGNVTIYLRKHLALKTESNHSAVEKKAKYAYSSQIKPINKK